jgi:type I restriction enzyme R subunit
VLKNKDVFKNVNQFNEYADKLLSKDDWRKGFTVYENTITSLYEACKPEILGNPIVSTVAVFQYLRGVVDSIIEQMDIESVNIRIGKLLDESLVADKPVGLMDSSKPEYLIKQSGKTWDLSKIDFEKLKEDFKHAAYKNIEISDLRAFIQHKLDQMLQLNATRTDFVQRLQGIIDAYNAGSSSADNYFEDLVKFTKDMKVESERHIREGLTEDELELFDLLKKDKMTEEETKKIRLAAKSLLHRLLQEQPKVLVQDWYKDSQTKERVRSTVAEVLHKHLPESYERVLFKQKCDNIFDLMVNYANQGLKWVA